MSIRVPSGRLRRGHTPRDDLARETGEMADLPEDVYGALRDGGHFAVPPEALARLAVSDAAAALSDAAAGLVATGADSGAQPGELVARAADLLDRAQAVLAAAVVAERAAGPSWSVVGKALGVSRQAAQERFRTAVTGWETGLDQPYTAVGDGGPDANLPEAALAPRTRAGALDRWLVGRGHAGSASAVLDDGPRRAARLAAAVVAASHRLTDSIAQGGRPAPVTDRMLAERKVAAFEAMSREQPGDSEVLALLADARARLAELSVRH